MCLVLRKSFSLLFSLFLSGGVQEVSVFVVWGLVKFGFFPQIRGQVSVGVGKSKESSLDEVTKGLSGSSGLSENVLDTSVLKNLLWCSGSDNTSTSWGRDKSYRDRTTFSGDLGWDSVRSTDFVTPISSSDWDNFEFSGNDSTTDGSGNFLSAFNSKTNMSVVISNDNVGLKSGSLTGTSLLLYRGNLHDFILQFGSNKPINDLMFLDWEREKVDVF